MASISSLGIGSGLSQSATEVAGRGGVNIAVAELDRMTQQNAALVEETTTAAEHLKDQADRLAETVGGFTLGSRAGQSPGQALSARRPVPQPEPA
jgi:methyl-accepting chemotaxis protein